MKNSVLDPRVRSSLLRMETAGAVFCFCAASALHFIYELSGGSVCAALFCSVNESVWEHMKIFSIPYVAWGFAEIFCLPVPFKRLACAKVCGLYVLTASIPVLFYTYTGILGKNIAVVDILCGAAGTALAFAASYRVASGAPYPQRFFKAAALLFALWCIATAFFTFSPPQLGLFRDPVSGGYGLPV